MVFALIPGSFEIVTMFTFRITDKGYPLEQDRPPQQQVPPPQQENQGNFLPQQGYPVPQVYLPPQGGYPPQQGYPPPQQGYPPQTGYPPQQVSLKVTVSIFTVSILDLGHTKSKI